MSGGHPRGYAAAAAAVWQRGEIEGAECGELNRTLEEERVEAWLVFCHSRLQGGP